MEHDSELAQEGTAFGSPDDRLRDNRVTENWFVPACLKSGDGGSKGLTELTRRERWSEREHAISSFQGSVCDRGQCRLLELRPSGTNELGRLLGVLHGSQYHSAS